VRVVDDKFVLFKEVANALETVAELQRAGVVAQVNHVLFATCCCGRPLGAMVCPPHPSAPGAMEWYEANPFYASPFYASPFYASPFYASPFYASPFYASPFYASPFYANPLYANPNPGLAGITDGRRRSSAVPVDGPEEIVEEVGNAVVKRRSKIRVAIVDTGYATDDFRPQGFLDSVSDGPDVPDKEPEDDFLDPVAGHGTFIAGVIEQILPGCSFEMANVIRPAGDGDEVTIGTTLTELANQEGDDPLDFVNLSFGGYSPFDMEPLAYAIAKLQANGTVVVASAGNDATCAPMFPAVLPGVVGVGALDEEGFAAPFTNYGPWVRASTRGVDVVSSFFRGWDGAEVAQDGWDPDAFSGWAQWSGTSFAAPRVVATLAQYVDDNRVNNVNVTPQQAVVALIDDPNLTRLPMLGTIVNPV
jgi:subtilisin family serine protease